MQFSNKWEEVFRTEIKYHHAALPQCWINKEQNILYIFKSDFLSCLGDLFLLFLLCSFRYILLRLKVLLCLNANKVSVWEFSVEILLNFCPTFFNDSCHVGRYLLELMNTGVYVHLTYLIFLHLFCSVLQCFAVIQEPISPGNKNIYHFNVNKKLKGFTLT